MMQELAKYQQLIYLSATPAYREYLRLAALQTTRTQQNYMQEVVNLERMQRLLQAINYSAAWFKRVILVGGTFGKGSVVSWLHRGLTEPKEAGRRVGAFYSPAVLNVCETIQAMPEEFIRPESLRDLYAKVSRLAEQSIKDDAPSHFELLLACALIYFQEQKCDDVVLEVGCGGAHDATNAVPHQVAVLTGVGDDHRPLLGATLLDVAREKAGIITKDGLFVTAEQNAVHQMLFAERCRELNSRLEFVSLSASHFAEQNRLLAQRVLHFLGESADLQGAAPFLPGRYLELKLAAHPESRLVIDGAHNADKALALANRLFLSGNKGWDTFLAVKSDKNLAAIAKALDPVVRSYFAAEAKGELDETTRGVELLAGELLRQVRKPVIIVDDFSETLSAALTACKEGQPLLVTGSFLIVRRAVIELLKWIEENGE